jgi:hypothetical protein
MTESEGNPSSLRFGVNLGRLGTLGRPGDAQEAAAELLRRRDRWGITSWCTHAPSGPALAEVLRAVRQVGA